MKRITLILIFLISFSAFSESRVDSCIRASKKHKSEIFDDKYKQHVVDEFFTKEEQDHFSKNTDTIVESAKESYKILKNEVKTYGIKDTIKINVAIFLPLIVFVILFLLWLKGGGNKVSEKK